MRIIEEVLNAGQRSVLIFEDDATFCDGFSVKAMKYLASLPGDWGQAYLGGQHLGRPTQHSFGIVIPRNVNRTHAYALRGPEAMIDVYRWLNAADHWVDRNHIDHHYGRLHKNRRIAVYAPDPWLCGQAADRSDISCKTVPERWWNIRQDSGSKFVAVIGLHRSGSSCVAMILHKLGVSMGDKLGGYESKNGGGGEAAGLAGICERAARFPATKIRDRARADRELASWVKRRMSKSKVSGGKYPHLCAMGETIAATCGSSLRIIHCDRPLEDSIDSLQRRSRKSSGWLAVSDADAEQVQRWLWKEKESFLSQHEHYNVKYADLLADPESVVDGLIEYLEIKPAPEQRMAAINHVKRSEVTA
jgi:hypothetical protein